MADQKRWFKLWCSAPADDSLQALPACERWAWAAFGCYTKLHGTLGRVQVSPSNAVLAAEMGVPVERLMSTIANLPNIRVEEGANRYGKVTVTWKNWTKYQEDSTVAERMKTLRSKRRGEEKRGEETRREEKHPPVVPPQGDPTFQQFWTAYPKARQIGKGKAEAAWRKVRPSHALVAEILAALERQKAGVRWREDGGRYVPLPATWLNQRRWEDTVTEGPILSPKTQGNLANLQAFIEANRDPR